MCGGCECVCVYTKGGGLLLFKKCLVLSRLCPCPCLFFWGGGWCELVCVCTRERAGLLFGVGWVF